MNISRFILLPSSIPFCGDITAGLPTRNGQSDTCQMLDGDVLHLPSGARTFALRVRGDSMRGAGILDGDNVIMEFRDPQPGEIVAALIDGETTLKRFVVQNGRMFLKAENPAYPSLIPAQELVIQGVMVALLRLPKNKNPLVTSH